MHFPGDQGRKKGFQCCDSSCPKEPRRHQGTAHAVIARTTACCGLFPLPPFQRTPSLARNPKPEPFPYTAMVTPILRATYSCCLPPLVAMDPLVHRATWRASRRGCWRLSSRSRPLQPRDGAEGTATTQMTWTETSPMAQSMILMTWMGHTGPVGPCRSARRSEGGETSACQHDCGCSDAPVPGGRIMRNMMRCRRALVLKSVARFSSLELMMYSKACGLSGWLLRVQYPQGGGQYKLSLNCLRTWEIGILSLSFHPPKVETRGRVMTVSPSLRQTGSRPSSPCHGRPSLGALAAALARGDHPRARPCRSRHQTPSGSSPPSLSSRGDALYGAE